MSTLIVTTLWVLTTALVTLDTPEMEQHAQVNIFFSPGFRRISISKNSSPAVREVLTQTRKRKRNKEGKKENKKKSGKERKKLGR